MLSQRVGTADSSFVSANCGGGLDRPQFIESRTEGGWTTPRESRSTPSRRGVCQDDPPLQLTKSFERAMQPTATSDLRFQQRSFSPPHTTQEVNCGQAGTQRTSKQYSDESILGMVGLDVSCVRLKPCRYVVQRSVSCQSLDGLGAAARCSIWLENHELQPTAYGSSRAPTSAADT